MIIGTAGHIDHGKTSLVRALTGVDLDSLPEEQARGITIALGFTRLELPSGRPVAFVDVPGHERLVRTMIAGASGFDAVLLCVSAQEGVMPQTREHLDILGLLGVRHGVVALTRADLVDPELAELAEEDIRELLEGTFLEDAPCVHTSAVEHTGIDALREALDGLVTSPRTLAGPLRLPVDRAFTQKGFGTVVTGTIASGQVSEGETVEVLPEGRLVRVRGVQVHSKTLGSAQAGMRCALNLSGADTHEVPRGSVVATPGSLAVGSILDVRYRHLESSPPLERGARVRLLFQTTEVMATADPLDGPLEPVAPGTHRLLQLRLAKPVASLPGDVFVIRRESPLLTLGGGTVIDPWAPRVRQRDAAAAADLLARMEAGEDLARIERAGLISREEVEKRLGAVPEGAVELGGSIGAPGQVQRMEQELLDSLTAWHQEHPLAMGAPKRSLHRGGLSGLDSRAFEDLLLFMESKQLVVVEGPRLKLAGHSVELSDADQSMASVILERLAKAGLSPPANAELLEGLGPAQELLALLLERHEIVRIEGRLYRADLLLELETRVCEALETQSELTTGDFKELSGLSRRHAIPLLEWLDSKGVTARVGDIRVRGNT